MEYLQQYPFIFSNERKYRLGRHFAFWAFWWIFQGFLYAFVPSFPGLTLMERLASSMPESLLFLTCHIFLSYTLMYFVLPVYLLKNRYLATAVWVMVLFLATAAMSSFVSLFVINGLLTKLLPAHLAKGVPVHRYNFYLGLLAGLRGAITVGGLAASIKLMKHWYGKQQRILQLQKENVESQLQVLKAQVHPHFLFNTLNNIYSYTQDTSPVASKLVLGLSDMLRYMLYEGSLAMVPLSKELSMVEEYVSLEKIRYGNKLEVNIDIPGNTQDFNIAPLLLLPLIENCFKHGTSNILENPWINLDIAIKDNTMFLKLLNGKPASVAKSTGGIGIQNVRKRLELLYPGKHELVVSSEEDVFIVTLKLELERRSPFLVPVQQTLVADATAV
jgi:hypothetical protein